MEMISTKILSLLVCFGLMAACEGAGELPDPVFKTTVYEGDYAGEAISTSWIGSSSSSDSMAVSWSVTAVNDSTVSIEEDTLTYDLVLDENGSYSVMQGSSNVYQTHFRHDSIIVYRRNGGLGGGWYYNAWLVKQ